MPAAWSFCQSSARQHPCGLSATGTGLNRYGAKMKLTGLPVMESPRAMIRTWPDDCAEMVVAKTSITPNRASRGRVFAIPILIHPEKSHDRKRPQTTTLRIKKVRSRQSYISHIDQRRPRCPVLVPPFSSALLSKQSRPGRLPGSSHSRQSNLRE